MSASPAGRQGRARGRLVEAGRVLLWAAVGALATPLDELHQATGITVYPNPDWVGERLPLSPAYAAGGTLFYLSYAVLFRRELAAIPRRGMLGGRPLGALSTLAAFALFALAYAASALGGARGLEGTAWPFATGALLALAALSRLRRRASGKLLLFALAVAALGTGFEWVAVAGGGYAYGVCPAPSCLGAPVPLAWLPALYLHAALLVDDLLGAAGSRPRVAKSAAG